MGFGYCWLCGWFVVLLIAIGKCAGWLFVLLYVCLGGLFGGICLDIVVLGCAVLIFVGMFTRIAWFWWFCVLRIFASLRFI